MHVRAGARQRLEPPGLRPRGYGWSHQQMRERFRPLVEAGECACARCGRQILPWEAWHLDHADGRGSYLGPSHQRCNVGASNRRRPKRRKRLFRAGGFISADGRNWSREWVS
jgi:hypothetical protein